MVTIRIVYLTVIRANDEWEWDFALKETTVSEMFLSLSFQMTDFMIILLRVLVDSKFHKSSISGIVDFFLPHSVEVP